MFNHLKSVHGACVKKGKQFMLVKINRVPSKLEQLQHLVCIYTFKKFLQFRFRKYLPLKLRARVKSIYRVTEINRAMVLPVLRQIMFPLQQRRDISRNTFGKK